MPGGALEILDTALEESCAEDVLTNKDKLSDIDCDALASADDTD